MADVLTLPYRAVVVTLLSCACAPAAPAAPSALERAASQAERESGVPRAVTLALSYAESRWTSVGSGSWVRLARGPGLPSPSVAARALGIDGRDLEATPALGVRAAAAMLAEHARATPGGGASPLTRWWPALLQTTGLEDPVAARLHADEILTIASIGVRATDEDGHLVVLPPVEPFPAAELDRARPDGVLGFAGAAWVPAAAGTHRVEGGRRAVTHVVVHTMEGTLPVILNHFLRPDTEVGAHYLVRARDGLTVQMIDERDVAFHDRCFNDATVGVEVEGFVAAGERWYQEATYDAVARLIVDVATRHGLPLDREHVIGHDEADDCSDHTDPGELWDWDALFARMP